MAPGARNGTEFDVCDLASHHLTAREEKVLLHHVANLGYVTSVRIHRNILFVTADFGKLEGAAFDHAHGMLISRATTQVERCKVRELRRVRHLTHS